MKALVVFESAHGCTEKCAGLLKEKLKITTDIVRLKDNPQPPLDNYAIIIIGGSIHMGEMNSRIRKFCNENHAELLKKGLALYICCMHEGDVAKQQFANGFDQELREHSAALGIFGGEFDFKKMNMFERAIVKKIAKVDSSVSKIRIDEVSKFAAMINAKYLTLN
jgi:menaquinone-dependent protoporphyrinogen oxidase